MEKKKKQRTDQPSTQQLARIQQVPVDIQQLIVSFVGKLEDAFDLAIALTVPDDQKTRQAQIQKLLATNLEFKATSQEQINGMVAFLASNPLKSRLRKIEINDSKEPDDFPRLSAAQLETLASFDKLHRFELKSIQLDLEGEIKRLPDWKQIVFSDIVFNVDDVDTFWKLFGNRTKRPGLEMLEWTIYVDTNDETQLMIIPVATQLTQWFGNVPRLQHLNLECHWRNEQQDPDQNLLLSIARNCQQIKTILLQNSQIVFNDDDQDLLEQDEVNWILNEHVIRTVFQKCENLQQLQIGEHDTVWEIKWERALAQDVWTFSMSALHPAFTSEFQLGCILWTGKQTWLRIETADDDNASLNSWRTYLEQLAEQKDLRLQEWHLPQWVLRKFVSSPATVTAARTMIQKLGVLRLQIRNVLNNNFNLQDKSCEVNEANLDVVQSVVTLLPNISFTTIRLQNVTDEGIGNLLFSKSLRQIGIKTTAFHLNPSKLLTSLVTKCAGAGVLEVFRLEMGITQPDAKSGQSVAFSIPPADWKPIFQSLWELCDAKYFPALVHFGAMFFNQLPKEVFAAWEVEKYLEIVQNKTGFQIGCEYAYLDEVPPRATTFEQLQKFMDRNPNLQTLSLTHGVWIKPEQPDAIQRDQKSTFLPFRSNKLTSLQIVVAHESMMLDDLVLLHRLCPNLTKFRPFPAGFIYPIMNYYHYKTSSSDCYAMPRRDEILRVATAEERTDAKLPSTWDLSSVWLYVKKPSSQSSSQSLQPSQPTRAGTVQVVSQSSQTFQVGPQQEEIVQALSNWKKFDEWCALRDQQDVENTLERWNTSSPSHQTAKFSKSLVRAMHKHQPLSLLDGRLQFDGQQVVVEPSLRHNPTIASLLSQLV